MAFLHHLDRGANKAPVVRRADGRLGSLTQVIVIDAGKDMVDISLQMQVVMLGVQIIA